MNILLTGGSSGVGQALLSCLTAQHTVDAPPRTKLDLLDFQSVLNYVQVDYNMLINCAGTDIGGKIDFINHDTDNIKNILQTNFVSPVLLTQAVLRNNPTAKIVNITSTNNNRYYQNNLAYSLSKKALEEFGKMLNIEYPHTPTLEVRLGLTKTNFNQNRYQKEPERFVDIYNNPHLTPKEVAAKIHSVLFDNSIKFIEISP